jgi:hypothetical protein
MGNKALLVAASLCLIYSSGAVAEAPSAIVEDVNASGAGVAFMDYVAAGRVIRLGAKGTLTLGYLRSCLRETITGGKVTVGAEQSKVAGAKLVRERIECDGTRLLLTPAQAAKSMGAVFRAPPPGSNALPQPQFTLYGASPVISLSKPSGTVVLKRLDRDAQDITIAVEGGFADLALLKKSLKPGGIYQARDGKFVVVFKVDRFARPGRGPLVGRLIRF